MSDSFVPPGKYTYTPVDLPEEITAEAFFNDFIPPIHRTLEKMGIDPEIDFVFELALSEPDDCWSVILEEGQFEIVHGPSPDADVRLVQTFEHWRQSALRLNGRDIRPQRMLQQINDVEKVELIQSVRGCIELDLLDDHGSIDHATRLEFSGSAKPSLSIQIRKRDYIDMARGVLNPAVALIQRKIKFRGDWDMLRRLAPLRKL